MTKPRTTSSSFEFDALEVAIEDGKDERVLYIGAMTAAELEQVSDAPRFQNSTTDKAIALSALNKPQEEWQRPLSDTKTGEITTRFMEPGFFMPNPVLLAVHPDHHANVDIDEITTRAATATNLFRIQIDTSNGVHPLLILDGQHRISGLAALSPGDSLIPLVLLSSDSDVV
ncbi:MAG: hypothetical protein VCA18_09630, partial [Opitutales bacterium]